MTLLQDFVQGLRASTSLVSMLIKMLVSSVFGYVQQEIRVVSASYVSAKWIPLLPGDFR